MKRKLFYIILAAIFVLIFSMTAFASSIIKVNINGDTLSFTNPPVIQNGTTLVPMRAIFEALGAEVNWDSKTKTVTGTKNDTKILLTINCPNGKKNGQDIKLTVPAKIINGNTFVPLRFISESFDCNIAWNNLTKIINITTKSETESLILFGPYDVLRIIDGDTIVIDYNGTEETVRMIGIDTPESVHPDASKNTEAGEEASEYTTSMLTGKEVSLEFDVQERDQYGRLLAYVYLGNEMFNKTLLREGYATLSTYPPNVKYVEQFTALEKEAKAAGVGFWEGLNIKTTGTYVGSILSNKYHLPTCRYAEAIKAENKIWFDTKEEAAAAGYTPCGVCKP